MEDMSYISAAFFKWVVGMLAAHKFSQIQTETVEIKRTKTAYYAIVFLTLIIVLGLLLAIMPVLFFSIIFGGGLFGLLLLAVNFSKRSSGHELPPQIRPSAGDDLDNGWNRIENREVKRPRARRATLTFKTV